MEYETGDQEAEMAALEISHGYSLRARLEGVSFADAEGRLGRALEAL